MVRVVATMVVTQINPYSFIFLRAAMHSYHKNGLTKSQGFRYGAILDLKTEWKLNRVNVSSTVPHDKITLS